jgi:hypothetical protein
MVREDEAATSHGEQGGRADHPVEQHGRCQTLGIDMAFGQTPSLDEFAGQLAGKDDRVKLADESQFEQAQHGDLAREQFPAQCRHKPGQAGKHQRTEQPGPAKQAQGRTDGAKVESPGEQGHQHEAEQHPQSGIQGAPHQRSHRCPNWRSRKSNACVMRTALPKRAN